MVVMAHTLNPLAQSSSWIPVSTQTLQAGPTLDPAAFQEDDVHTDLIRLARDNWAVQHAYVSDSSVIIDSIDVDMIDVNRDESTTEVYIVLDTNVLINHLVVLKQALVRIKAPGSELRVVLLVPGIVVSELDYQKNSARRIAVDSRKASDWLAVEIGNGRGCVKGQAYTQTMLSSGDWRKRCGLSNDELILDCCKYFGHVKRKDVLLCTSDNNLAVQASSNAANLFVRDVSAVIRPHRNLWDAGQLLERAVPGFEQSLMASMHASPPKRRGGGRDSSRGYPGGEPVLTDPGAMSYGPVPHRTSVPDDDESTMEVDVDVELESQSLPRTAGDRRDLLHRQMSAKLAQQLRMLTGQAANLQRLRRERESVYSPANAELKGAKLPTERDWSQAWSLRECLKLLSKVPPLQPRSWTFGEAEASSLADFLGMPGEKGARPGREWAKHDWGRELATVRGLGQDFQLKGLDNTRMAEYEYEVMEVFAVD